MAVSGAARAGQEVPPRTPVAGSEPGIHKIRHVIVIMQENRSFDSYFGAFPGADGIPAGVCLPDSRHGGRFASYDPACAHDGRYCTSTAL
jgi:phospholipase C